MQAEQIFSLLKKPDRVLKNLLEMLASHKVVVRIS